MSGTRMSVPPKFPSNAPTVLSNGRLYNRLLSTGKSFHFVYIMYPTSKLEHRHFIVSKDYVFLRIGSFAIVSKIINRSRAGKIHSPAQHGECLML